MSDLRSKYEAVLMEQLESINGTSPIGKDGAPALVWPPKERVELLKVVREYLAETQKGPEWGKDLK